MTDTIFCTIAVSSFVVGLLLGFLLGRIHDKKLV
jgi:ElaB/YqjD/DUF883 family membrane-anchored ribosome-binding protein